jgi:hypothetical protein
MTFSVQEVHTGNLRYATVQSYAKRPKGMYGTDFVYVLNWYYSFCFKIHVVNIRRVHVNQRRRVCV